MQALMDNVQSVRLDFTAVVVSPAWGVMLAITVTRQVHPILAFPSDLNAFFIVDRHALLPVL